MSNNEKQRKSKGVLLCRSKQQPDGKEIQGLVFDHPSMPKIVTISSGPRKKSSSGNNPQRARREQNPAGEKSSTGEKSPTSEKSPTGGKYPTGHRPHEQYETGHFTRQHAARHSTSQPTTTVHYTPAQNPIVIRTSAQNPSSSSPPALIHTPSQYSTHQQTPGNVRQFHTPDERAIEGSRAEIPAQTGKSQIRFPPYYRNGPSAGMPLPPTLSAAQNTQFQCPQHEQNSARTQEIALRRKSTGALRHHLETRVQHRENLAQHRENIVQRPENLAQYRENLVQHSHNIPQHSIELGKDDFSRDFHLHVWHQSHQRAIRDWRSPTRGLNQPTRGLDPPVRRLGHPAQLPLTSGHNVDGTVSRYWSLSTSAGFPGERGYNLSHQRANPQPGQYGNNTRSPRQIRRFSTGYVGSAYSEVCTTGPQNAPEGWTHGDYSPRVRSAEGTNARVPSARTVRRSSNITEYIPTVRNAEGRSSQVVNSSHLRSSSSNSSEDYNPVVRNVEGRNSQVINTRHPINPSSNSREDYNPVVRNAEGRNLEELNASNLRTSSNIGEDYNPVVQCAEGRNLEVSSADSIRKSNSLSNESERQANIQRRRRRIKRQRSPTVVVISDSDDEEMKILSPLSNDEFDQDVFAFESNNQASLPNPVVRESPGSPQSSESDEACVITKVKAPGDRNKTVGCESQGSTWSSKTGQESRAYDVDNNKSREGMGTSNEQNREGMGMIYEQSRGGVRTSYRSVLYEREITGQTGTQRVIMSEQLFDKDNRGTKRPLEYQSQYFVAGSAEIAGSPLNDAVRKIRRVSCTELGSNNAQRKPNTDLTVDVKTCHQSSQDKRGSGENFKPNLMRSHDDMPKLVRCRSENDEQSSKPKWKSERSTSLTCDTRTFSKQRENTEDCIINPDVIKKVEPIESCKLSSKTPNDTKPHCDVCLDGSVCVVRVPEVLLGSEASGLLSRDEIRCRNCDRVLNEYRSPGNDISHTVVKLPKSGPKPTGIVVGIKQAPEVEQPLESEIVGSENDLKSPLQSKAAALEKELKQLLERKTVGSEKPAKNSGITYVTHEDDDIIYKDKTSSKVSDDLDVLQFSVVKKDSDITWTNSKDHVKNIASSRDQVHSSQQWQAYSLKLEQEQMAKNSCAEKGNKVFNIKRNSWEELKKRFASGEKRFSEGTRDCVPCSDAARKRAHSEENVLDTLSGKSYKFHDATKKLSKEYKRQKLSEESGTQANADSFDKVSENEVFAIRENDKDHTIYCETHNTIIHTEAISSSSYSSTKVSTSVASNSSNMRKNMNTVDCETLTKPSDPPKDCTQLVFTNGSDYRSVEMTKSPTTVDFTETVPAKTQEFSLPEDKPCEIRPSEEKSLEVNTQNPSEENTRGNDLYEIRPSNIRPPEIEPASPGEEPQASPQKEDLSLQEWTDILQGRIAQVRESIEEERAPWKTKNKKKVLEKLENHLTWMMGPEADEAIFVARKLQFFQTMRKQYELMNKVKTQRHTMKFSDGALQIAENMEKPKGKAAKEVEVSKKTKDVKKTVKCRPKSVKNSQGAMMKKIRKAVLS